MIGSIYRLAKWSAVFGGFALVVLTLMIVISVTGRALIGVGLGPIPGDFELAEVATAIAVFYFMPWCYLRDGHATVDLLYMHLPRGVQRTVVTVSDLLMLGVWLVMTWKLWEGMLEKREYMETTFILQMPIWWAYAFCVVGAVIGCAAYIAKTMTQLGLASPPAGWSVETLGGH
ncbi:TRAP transporter small permease [Hydrogenophaga sp.]|uniref:TRAP transporter small permease n=1 Tax=Hydrogenophaga sp. TaxID=1904254 RepID=UPI003569DE7F